MVLNNPGSPVSEIIYLSCLVITKICPELKVVYDCGSIVPESIGIVYFSINSCLRCISIDVKFREF